MRTRSTMPRAIPRAATILWLVLGVPLALLAIGKLQPSAIGILSRGDLIVLDGDQGFFRLSPGSNRAIRIGALPGAFSYSDLMVATVGGRESIFATASVSTASQTFNRIVWLDGSGKTVKLWDLMRPDYFAGLALDPKREQLYVVNAETCEIFRIDLKTPKAVPVWFATLRKAQGLGPLVMDDQRNRLLLGDPVRGTLYVLDLQTRRAEIFAEKLGEPSALAIDPASDRLFVADAAGRRIWVRNLGGASSSFQIFAKDGLDQPLGLAVSPDGTVWVGDHDRHTLLSYSSTGARLKVLKPVF